MRWLKHSAKGTTWEEHKYIKRLDGVYYYPDSYEGGRHLPGGNKKKDYEHGEYKEGDKDFDDSRLSEATRVAGSDFHSFVRDDGKIVVRLEDQKWVLPAGTKVTLDLCKQLSGGSGGGAEASKSNLEDWEVKMHKHIADIVEKHPDMFKTTDDISKNIMASVNSDAFKNTLKAITGKDPDKMSSEELNSMRKKISDYYTKDYSDADSVKASKKEKKSSENKEEKKEALNKNDNYDYGHRETEKKSNKPATDKLMYKGGKKQTEMIRSKSKVKHSSIGSSVYLIHYNHNHDALGRFARSRFGGGIRRASDMSDDELKRSVQRMNLEKQYNKLSGTKSNSEHAKSIFEETSKATNIARNALDSNNRRRYERMDLSKMSDQQLRDAINRENLEIQYSQMFNSKEVSKGKQVASNILGVAGSVAAIGASAVTIAVGINTLMQNQAAREAVGRVTALAIRR